MDVTLQVALSMGVPTLAVLVEILLNNRQLDQLQGEMNQRFTDLYQFLDAKFEAQHQAMLRVEGIIDARLKHLEER